MSILYKDVLLCAFEYCSTFDLITHSFVCKEWNSACATEIKKRDINEYIAYLLCIHDVLNARKNVATLTFVDDKRVSINMYSKLLWKIINIPDLVIIQVKNYTGTEDGICHELLKKYLKSKMIVFPPFYEKLIYKIKHR